MVGDGEELTPIEAARILGVSASTVRRYENRGHLTSRRLLGSRHRRYRRTDVVELKRKIDAGELGAEPPGPTPDAE